MAGQGAGAMLRIDLCCLGGEFGLAGDGGSVDPAVRDRVGEDVDGGVLAVGWYVGVVVVAASGHRYVDASTVGWPVEKED